jgi:hypothetical protein
MTNYIVRLFLDLGQVRLPKGKLVRKPKSILSVFQKHIQFPLTPSNALVNRNTDLRNMREFENLNPQLTKNVVELLN